MKNNIILIIYLLMKYLNKIIILIILFEYIIKAIIKLIRKYKKI